MIINNNIKHLITSDELKSIQLEILKIIADYCSSNNLKYFLFYGTLLGAVRHKGYIPWDDDIDIAMPRPDYEKLMTEFNKLNCFVKVVCPSNNADYTIPFGKAYDSRTLMVENKFNPDCYGVYIDIFPIDGICSKLDYICLGLLQRFRNTKCANLKTDRRFTKKVVLALGKLILYPVSVHTILKSMEGICKKNSYEEARFVNSLYDNQKKIRKQVFTKSILWAFEQYQFMIPEMYDEYLTVEYGNYMQLPPENEQIPHHDFIAWWK